MAVQTTIGSLASEAETISDVHPGPDLYCSGRTQNFRIFILLDGTHSRVMRSSNPDWRRYVYSGKKSFTYNTNAITAPNGMMWIGKNIRTTRSISYCSGRTCPILDSCPERRPPKAIPARLGP